MKKHFLLIALLCQSLCAGDRFLLTNGGEIEATVVSVPSLHYTFGYVDFSPQDLQMIRFEEGRALYTTIDGVTFAAQPDTPLITLDNRKKVNIKNVQVVYFDTVAALKPSDVQEIVFKGGDRVPVVNIKESSDHVTVQLAGRQERYQLPEKNIEKIIPVEEVTLAFEENMDEQPLDDQPIDSFHTPLAANLPPAGWTTTVLPKSKEEPFIAELTYPKAKTGISHCLFAPFRAEDSDSFCGLSCSR